MGRELKRVPLDFKWPEGQIWKGFVNPYRPQTCKACDQTALNPATREIYDDWYGKNKPTEWVYPNGQSGRRYNNAAWCYHLTEVEVKALVEAGRLYDLTRDFIPGTGWVEKVPAYMPTPEEVNNWAINSMGHDAINRWVCVKARGEHLGVWGKCEHCEDGEIWQTPEIKKLSEDWKSFEPPVGDGFQLWSTTTEGHPMSPVFDSLSALCEYLDRNQVSLFGSSTATKEEWESMLGDGFVVHKDGNNLFI